MFFFFCFVFLLSLLDDELQCVTHRVLRGNATLSKAALSSHALDKLQQVRLHGVPNTFELVFFSLFVLFSFFF